MSRIVRPSSSRQPGDLGPHLGAHLRVEPGRRLVEEQHLRAVDEAHRDVEPPLHAARVAARDAARGRRPGRTPRAAGRRARAARARAAPAGDPAGRRSRGRSGRRRRPSSARRRRSRAARRAGSAHDVERRRRCASPPSARASVVSTFTAVDLPAPLGPSRPKIVPGLHGERQPVERLHVAVRLPQVRCLDHQVLLVCFSTGQISYFSRYLNVKTIEGRFDRRADASRCGRRRPPSTRWTRPPAKALGINRTDARAPRRHRCAKGPVTAGRLAEESGLTTAAVTARARPPREGRLRAPRRRPRRPPPRARGAHPARARAGGRASSGARSRCFRKVLGAYTIEQLELLRDFHRVGASTTSGAPPTSAGSASQTRTTPPSGSRDTPARAGSRTGLAGQ